MDRKEVVMQERYIRNIPAISELEQELLKTRRVLICGCGGLGGHLIDAMARMGVGTITVVDGDRIEENNLNRQILALETNLGEAKVRMAQRRVAEVNTSVRLRALDFFLDSENAYEVCTGHNLVLDALDNYPARLLLETTCADLSIPIVHGAVEGWRIQAAIVPPGSGLLNRIYAGVGHTGVRTSLPFAASTCAAIQAAEAVKLLCGREVALSGKLLMCDLWQMSWEIADFNEVGFVTLNSEISSRTGEC